MLWNSINNFFKEKYGERVHRIAVDAGFTCPNRDGTKGLGGCSYCGEEGARARYVDPDMSVKAQILKGIEHISRRYKASKFIAYFQAYSNTYADISRLEKVYYEAITADERIVGLAVSTRTDCINDEILHLLNSLSKKTFLWVEYGLQSVRQDILDKINRCDTVNNFTQTVLKTNEFNIPVVAHIICGFPEETKKDIVETALLLNNLNIWGIKFHSLYLTRDSALGKQFIGSPFPLLNEDEYVSRAADFLENLKPSILIHRLSSDVSADKLIAPDWIKNKQSVLKKIEYELIKRKSYQGYKYLNP